MKNVPKTVSLRTVIALVVPVFLCISCSSDDSRGLTTEQQQQLEVLEKDEDGTLKRSRIEAMEKTQDLATALEEQQVTHAELPKTMKLKIDEDVTSQIVAHGVARVIVHFDPDVLAKPIIGQSRKKRLALTTVRGRKLLTNRGAKHFGDLTLIGATILELDQRLLEEALSEDAVERIELVRKATTSTQ